MHRSTGGLDFLLNLGSPSAPSAKGSGIAHRRIVTPYFLRDLALRHLVGRFEAGDAQIEFVPLDTLPEFALGLAGAE